MKVSLDGQVTVPQYIRESLGLLPNTEVQWELRAGEAILRRAPGDARGRGREFVEKMRGRGTVRMSTDEIIALTRGD
jgi:bifunctional DNA-binding transcriptional regulator/antitoxin component of YhaV-PrlF toxin-antitoxin module